LYSASCFCCSCTRLCTAYFWASCSSFSLFVLPFSPWCLIKSHRMGGGGGSGA
jgi:hypothetical protein